MAQQTINIGSVANDGTGDSLREAGAKINENFTEIYSNILENETVSANGTVDSDSQPFIICDKSSTLAISLDDGSAAGEVKYFVNKGSGTANITPGSSFITQLSLDQGEGATMAWDGSYWYVLGTSGTIS